MDCYDGLVACVVEVDHHLSYKYMSDALSGPCVRSGSIPNSGQIACERHQRHFVHLRTRRRDGIMAVDAFLKCGDTLKSDVPPVLKFARDKTFRRIDGFVPSGGQ